MRHWHDDAAPGLENGMWLPVCSDRRRACLGSTIVRRRQQDTHLTIALEAPTPPFHTTPHHTHIIHHPAQIPHEISPVSAVL